MAKKSSIHRDLKRDRLIAKYDAKRTALREKGDYEGLTKLPRNASPTRRKNRCAISGRSRGYMRRFGLCRIEFRELASKGMIMGVRKSSW
jgi:small subunit ribosomal protein S14